MVGGGGVSAAGVAARATPYAAAGAALAGAVAIIDKFYGVDKQNLAWTKAAHGLRCVKAVSTYIYVNANHLPLVGFPDNLTETALRPALPPSAATPSGRCRVDCYRYELAQHL